MNIETMRPKHFGDTILEAELLSNIFIHCLPVDHLPKLSIKEGPLLLGRVCSAWRKSVYSTPQLWTGFEIEIKEGMKFNAVAVEFWISKSETLPISICLYDKRSHECQKDRKMDEHVLAFIYSLCTRSHLWKRFILRGNSSISVFPGLDRIMQVFATSPGTPLLEDLEIDFPYLRSNTVESLDFSLCPNLIKFSFNINKPPETCGGNWSLSQLRHFVLLEYLRLKGVSCYLRRSPRVEKVKFLINDWDPNVGKEGILTLPKLSDLTIEFGYNDKNWDMDLSHFFLELHLPALEAVTFRFDLNWTLHGSPYWHDFPSLLARSKPPLKSFRILTLRQNFGLHVWAETLKHMPLLRHLTLQTFLGDMSTGDAIPILMELTLSEGSCEDTFSCPLLEELAIESHVESPFEFSKAFADMLHSRLKEVGDPEDLRIAKLRRVYLTAHIDSKSLQFNEADIAKFEQYRRNGLELYIIEDGTPGYDPDMIMF